MLEHELAQLESDRNPIYIAQLQRQLEADATWAPGGTGRQVLTALPAAAGGNVTGASAQFAQHLVVNYMQQGAGYIGNLVREGKLTEGSPLHAALHAVVACAGSAASTQSCGSTRLDNTLDGRLGSESWMLGSGRLARAVGSDNSRNVVAAIQTGRYETWVVTTRPDGSTIVEVLDAVGKSKPVNTSNVLIGSQQFGG